MKIEYWIEYFKNTLTNLKTEIQYKNISSYKRKKDSLMKKMT